MLTRRDVFVALIAVTGTLAVVGAQQPARPFSSPKSSTGMR